MRAEPERRPGEGSAGGGVETNHNAPPGIALALPTEQQVLGEREQVPGRGKEESKKTGWTEKNLES